MSETPVLDGTTLQCGLLMESAQAQQKLAQGQLEQLRAHTNGLDDVVRDEIRRTLVEELHMLSAEILQATRALQSIRRAARGPSAVWRLGAVVLGAALPLGVSAWLLPSASEMTRMRHEREALSANIAALEQHGGRVELQRCGVERRLCVRIDPRAPAYGPKSDFRLVATP